MFRQLVLITFFSISARSENFELSFPAQLNGLTVAPQQFEYALIDSERIKIGDVILDSRRMNFDFIQNKQNLIARARFSWPGGLFGEGEIAVRDSVGKLVWSQNVSDRQTQENKASTTRNREFASTLETEQDVQQLTQQLELYPFFKACVQRRDGSTQIFLCSKDLYIKKVRAKLQILERQIQRPESFIEINGRPVSRQGVLVLNSPQESISFRAFFQSGVTLEISTSTKSVQFNNAFLTEDKKQIVLRASGARPVYKERVKDLPNGEWETNLDVERPITYLQGEGQIPMRQEFSISGNIMHKPLRVAILQTPKSTISSSLNLKVQTDPSFTLKAAAGSSIERIEPGLWQWNLSELQKDQQNIRKLSLLAEGQTLTAEYKIERIRFLDIQASASFPMAVGLDIHAFSFHPWLFNVAYSSDMGSQSAKITSLRPRLFYDFNNSKFKQQALHAFGLGMNSILLKAKDPSDMDANAAISLLNLSYIYEWNIKHFGPFYFLQAALDYSPSKLSGEISLTSAAQVSLLLRSVFKSAWYIETGLQSRRFIFQDESTQKYSASQTGAILAIGQQF